MAAKKEIKSVASRAASKGGKKAGDRYTCNACGLAVTVDEECCCLSPCDLVCCDMPMKKTRSKK